IEGTDLIFITAGMGGGTGTGAAPIIADIAKEQGALVVSLVTYPFKLERARLKKAQEGIEELKRSSDTLVLIDNNRLLEYAPNLPIERSFEIIDEITSRAVRGITDTICKPSLLNLDFADVRSVMQGGGVSMIAVGEGAGVERVNDVVKNTMHHRFLDVDYEGAKGALLHLTGGPELTIGEVNEVGERFTEAVDRNANVVLGARHDPSFSAKIEAITIFTGIKSDYILGGERKEGGEIIRI
ncbi:cell division protein FtsZ, partial [Candidatus Micrarchaeota archaeon CG11_big_fil_rev_8_21_14_0_20_47_5]